VGPQETQRSPGVSFPGKDFSKDEVNLGKSSPQEETPTLKRTFVLLRKSPQVPNCKGKTKEEEIPFFSKNLGFERKNRKDTQKVRKKNPLFVFEKTRRNFPQKSFLERRGKV